MKTGEILIYQKEDGQTTIDVRLEHETVWLTQKQIADLFGTEVPAISKHVGNIYKDGELNENSTVSKMEIVQQEGKRKITREISHYNLDMILSVGYRVNSQNATKFRIWANKVLKDYLVKGYAVNEKIKTKQYEELKQTVKLLSNVIQNKELSADEATGLLQVITDYTYALDTLDKYDYQELTVEQTTQGDKFHATYENAMEAIMSLKSSYVIVPGYKKSFVQ